MKVSKSKVMTSMLRDVHIDIQKGIVEMLEACCRRNTDNNIAFGELEPSGQSAAAKEFTCLPRAKMIEMKIVNVPKVKVIISKIYESNLLARSITAMTRETGTEEMRMRYDDDYYYSNISNG